MIRTSVFALALGLSLSMMACSTAASDEGAASASAQTGPQIEPGPVESVSADGRTAANALVSQAATLFAAPDAEEIAPFKEWLDVDASEFYVEHPSDTSVTFYFRGDVVVEGDIIEGSKLLVIEASYAEWGPTYTTRLSNDDIPATATPLTNADGQVLSALAGLTRLATLAPDEPAAVELRKFASAGVSLDEVSVQHVAPGSTSFNLSAQIIEEGDIIAGDASLSVTATRDPNPEYNVVRFTATATLNHQ